MQPVLRVIGNPMHGGLSASFTRTAHLKKQAMRGAEMTAERLSQLLSACRKPSLIALEDVDCLKVATSRKSKSTEGLTMADFLNVIDGIGASEERVLFMTANHPETLDAALTRAGRVDRKFYIDYARDEELQSFHRRIAQYYPVQPWPEFRAALPGAGHDCRRPGACFPKGRQ